MEVLLASQAVHREMMVDGRVDIAARITQQVKEDAMRLYLNKILPNTQYIMMYSMEVTEDPVFGDYVVKCVIKYKERDE